MSKEVQRKKFQRGLLGIIFGYSFLGLLVTCFCVTRVEPNAIHHICHEQGEWGFADVVGLRGDSYVVPTHNVAEGTLLEDKDVEVVVMPVLKGCEKAFGDAEAVIGRTVSHAFTKGQPVLPNHLKKALKKEVDVFDME